MKRDEWYVVLARYQSGGLAPGLDVHWSTPQQGLRMVHKEPAPDSFTLASSFHIEKALLGNDSTNLPGGFDLGALFVFDRALSDSELLQVHDYLDKGRATSSLVAFPAVAPGMMLSSSMASSMASSIASKRIGVTAGLQTSTATIGQRQLLPSQSRNLPPSQSRHRPPTAQLNQAGSNSPEGCAVVMNGLFVDCNNQDVIGF
jgi:hypothetical protein